MNAMIDSRLLADIELFRALDEQARGYLRAAAEVVTFPPRTVLFHQGDPPTACYALQAGRVKLYRESRSKCQILALPMPGDCFGAEAYPSGTTQPYTAATLTTATCIRLDIATLSRLLEESPDFQEAFLRHITRRLRQFVTLVHDLAFRDVSSRVAMVLVQRAAQEGQPTAGGVSFERLLTQQELAAMVGTAREMVYRTFKRFEAEGLIEVTPRRITILDMDTLSAIAAQEAR
ncbi:MAG: Crp/Fnr family transcriptional regulator [Anaerolineae bacterium]